jgi:hypothetical protein
VLQLIEDNQGLPPNPACRAVIAHGVVHIAQGEQNNCLIVTGAVALGDSWAGWSADLTARQIVAAISSKAARSW